MKLALILILFLSTNCFAYKEELLIGYVDSSPHVKFENELASGPLVDYIKRLFEHSNFDLEFIKLPKKRAEQELDIGRVDIVMPVANKQSKFLYIDKPLFYSVPGLCFKKAKFIPILSAKHLYKSLNIGIPAGTLINNKLITSFEKIAWIEGANPLERGVHLLLKDRIDALYHPSPMNVYHFSNPLSKTIACSYFHGYSISQHIVISPHVRQKKLEKIIKTINNGLDHQHYEQFFASASAMSEKDKR